MPLGMKNLPLIVSLLSILLVVFTLFRLREAEQQLSDLKKAERLVHVSPGEEQGEGIEVAVFMQRLQVFANKLYASSSNGEDELVEFYLHEMGEVMDQLVEANVSEDGFNVSENMEIFGIRALEEYSKAYAGKVGNADEYHMALVMKCNACHTASGHGFLQMSLPSSDRIEGQLMDLECWIHVTGSILQRLNQSIAVKCSEVRKNRAALLFPMRRSSVLFKGRWMISCSVNFTTDTCRRCSINVLA